MNIYQKSGYIDIRAIMAIGLPFNFIVGGRATGKTYTSLETVKEDGIKQKQQTKNLKGQQIMIK